MVSIAPVPRTPTAIINPQDWSLATGREHKQEAEFDPSEDRPDFGGGMGAGWKVRLKGEDHGQKKAAGSLKGLLPCSFPYRHYQYSVWTEGSSPRLPNQVPSRLLKESLRSLS